MIAALKTELSKALCNPWFIGALVVGTALACLSAHENIGAFFQSKPFSNLPGKFYSPFLDSAYVAWMSVEGITAAGTLFYKLAPFLATLPFSWSLASERASGYANAAFTRIERSTYLKAKCAACFISGGLVVVIPQAVNLVILACFMPMCTPVITDALHIGISHSSLFSFLFYNMPPAYVAAYLALDFILCGLWATFVLLLGYLVKKPTALLSAPYLFLLVAQFVNEKIFVAMGDLAGRQFSLFENLKAATDAYTQSWSIIIPEAALLALCCLALFVIFSKGDEL